MNSVSWTQVTSDWQKLMSTTWWFQIWRFIHNCAKWVVGHRHFLWKCHNQTSNQCQIFWLLDDSHPLLVRCWLTDLWTLDRTRLFSPGFKMFPSGTKIFPAVYSKVNLFLQSIIPSSRRWKLQVNPAVEWLRCKLYTVTATSLLLFPSGTFNACCVTVDKY